MKCKKIHMVPRTPLHQKNVWPAMIINSMCASVNHMAGNLSAFNFWDSSMHRLVYGNWGQIMAVGKLLGSSFWKPTCRWLAFRDGYVHHPSNWQQLGTTVVTPLSLQPPVVVVTNKPCRNPFPPTLESRGMNRFPAKQGVLGAERIGGNGLTI